MVQGREKKKGEEKGRRKKKKGEEKRREEERKKEKGKRRWSLRPRRAGTTCQGWPVPPAMGGRHLQLEARRLPQALPRVCLGPVLPPVAGRYLHP
jgi:hypothetical protein